MLKDSSKEQLPDNTLSNKNTSSKKEDKLFSKLAKDKEFGGSRGLEPTRYGDWEVNGRVSDF